MAEGASKSLSVAETSGTLDKVLDGVPEEIARQVTEALAVYAAPTRGPQEDVGKATRLRGAFTVLIDYLMGKLLPDLNDAQWTFMSTGMVGQSLARGDDSQVEMVPSIVAQHILSARKAKANKPSWATTILDVEDRVNAIARGELVGLDSGNTRRRKAAKPLGSDQLKEKVRARLESHVGSAKEQLSGVESQITAFGAMRDEKIFNALKLNFEAMRKYILLAGKGGVPTEQEARLLSSVGEKLGGITQSVVSVASQMEKTGRELAARARTLEERLREVRDARESMAKLEAGEESSSAAFDPDTIAAIRKDEDTLASFVVKAAETAENKVAFSGARILVKEQWADFPGAPGSYLATIPGVVAAIEKIAKIHVNVFPRDQDGHFVLPPIVIEPIRNFVEYFDDRLVMSFVCGDLPRKGPKLSLSPLEIQVLKACGHYLSKDPLYDHRGDLNVGTFIGDYSGRTEKTTSVRWTGADKKFSLGMSSQVVDSASRSEAVQNYVDCVFAFANGMGPPQKLSRRKVAILLRYCIIESPERTVALALMHAAQAEPTETKETIMKLGKTEENARALVGKAFDDPHVARVCGDKEYFLTKLFGKK